MRSPRAVGVVLLLLAARGSPMGLVWVTSLVLQWDPVCPLQMWQWV